MNPQQWILGEETGISSKTIWGVMMNAIPEHPSDFYFGIPHDPSDFGRCYRLLKLFPEWRARLHEVANIFPNWTPMVREWDRMTELYEKEMLTGRASQLYALMQELEDEGRIIDGWIQKSSGCWEKKK